MVMFTEAVQCWQRRRRNFAFNRDGGDLDAVDTVDINDHGGKGILLGGFFPLRGYPPFPLDEKLPKFFAKNGPKGRKLALPVFRWNFSFTENDFAHKSLAELGVDPPYNGKKSAKQYFAGSLMVNKLGNLIRMPDIQRVQWKYQKAWCTRKTLRPPFHFEKLICNLQKVSPAEELREGWTRIPLSP